MHNGFTSRILSFSPGFSPVPQPRGIVKPFKRFLNDSLELHPAEAG
jgi:hypothetical protein